MKKFLRYKLAQFRVRSGWGYTHCSSDNYCTEERSCDMCLVES